MPNILTRVQDTAKYVVYGIRLWNEDEYRYVGYTTVGTHSRSIEHMKDAKKYKTPFYNWYRKYAGRVQIVMEVIESCDDGEISLVKFREQFWIATYREQFQSGIRKKSLLNLSSGGDGFNGVRGQDHPNYGKIGWNKGIPMDESMKRHLSATKTGIAVHSDEQKAKWSESRAAEGNAMFGLKGDDHPAYGFRHGDIERGRRSKRSSGEGNVNARITSDIVALIRSDSREGLSLPQLSEKYGLSKSHLCNIVNRKSWKHVP